MPLKRQITSLKSFSREKIPIMKSKESLIGFRERLKSSKPMRKMLLLDILMPRKQISNDKENKKNRRSQSSRNYSMICSKEKSQLNKNSQINKRFLIKQELSLPKLKRLELMLKHRERKMKLKSSRSISTKQKQHITNSRRNQMKEQNSLRRNKILWQESKKPIMKIRQNMMD